MIRSVALLAGLLCAVSAPAAETTLIARGSAWRYLDAGANPVGNWADAAFDDQAWRSGPAQLGYGDGDEATLLSYGGNAAAKPIATYLRRTFNVAGAANLRGLTLHLLRDDGARVFLNGAEVRRDNLPAGAIEAATPAVAAIGGADESTFFASTVDSGLLREGANLLAVELHQASPTSSDVSFDLELIGSDGAARVVRGPYLQRGQATGVVVRWRTDYPTDSRVRYGTAVGALIASATDAAATTEHAVALSGLSADTRYYYSVGDSAEVLAGGDAAHTFHTAPSPGTAKPTRIWVLGDSGTGGAGARAVRDAFLAFADGLSPDLWLMLGDNAYTRGTDAEYQAGLFDVYQAVLRASVLWPTLGNHDGQSADSATQSGPYYDIFTLPSGGEAGGVASGTEAYYAFDHGRVHFICLESYETDRSPSGAMLSWLVDDLEAAAADWVIAFWHHPPYTKGSHDSDVESELIQMRQNVLPILEAYGVDLVLTGHSHAYERSVLLDGHYGSAATLTQAMRRDGGAGPYHKASPGLAPHQGAVYVVAGSGAQASGGALNHPAMSVSLNVRGSLVLDVAGQALTARFLDDAGVVRDAFTISKGGLPTPTPTATATPAPTAAVSGQVRHYASGQPVGGVTLADGAISDAGGAFSVTGPLGAPLTVRPSKRGSGDAVSALDAARILQVSAGLRTFDAVQALACDVTGDGTISALDAARVLQLVVGLRGSLPVADLCGSDFAFIPSARAAANQTSAAAEIAAGLCVPASIAYQPLAGAAGGQDFLAAAFGDCTGNWRP
ncbi:MAG: metallophosphoesterase [Candidatus Binatia bacterium]